VLPPPGSLGDAPRNAFIGPHLVTDDFAIIKNTQFGERVNVQFRAEAFNVFNHPNLGNPSGCVDCSGGNTINNLANNAFMRKMQFGLRVDF